MIYFVKYLDGKEVGTCLTCYTRAEADKKAEEMEKAGYPAWIWEEDMPGEHEIER
jgi:hypothetical protein